MKPSVPSVCLSACLCILLGTVACIPAGEPDPEVPELRELVLLEPPAEHTSGDVWSASQVTLRRVLEHIDAVTRDSHAKGLFLRLGGFGGTWAKATELSRALQRVREAGKPVHCHLNAADNVSYVLAAQGCDRLTATPGALIDVVGVSARALYAKELLDQLGVQAELMQMGRFKGAADALTRNEMPEPTRQSMGAILDVLQSQLVTALTQARKLDEAGTEAAIAGGPYDAHDAKRAGLVDDVEFDDEAREHARRAAGAERRRKLELTPPAERLGLSDLFALLFDRDERSEPEGARIALVYLTGTIADDGGPLQGVSPGRFIDKLRKLADDDDVRAVVLRIDSPGGSAAASDRMWHAVRRVSKRKPVIASIGDMGASGGYYVASAARRIVASDTSLVGSIGVVGGKIAIGDLTDRIGVQTTILQRGERAAWSTPFRAFQPGERRAVERLLEATYTRFLRRVAQGRDMPRAQVVSAAEGRLMTGHAAREHGLVDAEGGLDEALAWAREQGKLSPQSAVEVWPPPRTMIEQLTSLMGGPTSRAADAPAASLLPWALAVPREVWQPILDLVALLQSGGGAAAMAPYAVTFR